METLQPGTGPVRNIFFQSTFIEWPFGLLKGEFRMGRRKLFCRGGGVVPCPVWIAAENIVQILHASIGGHNVGAGGD